MKDKDLDEAREQGRDIAEILSMLHSLGFDFSDYQKGYLACLMEQCRTPTIT